MSKGKKMIAGISSIALMTAMVGCSSSSNQATAAPPEDPQCKDWEYDSDDGVWECDDDSSSFYKHYYHNGSYYSSKSSLKNSSSYKSSVKSSSNKSSGFGSGSKSSSFGG